MKRYKKEFEFGGRNVTLEYGEIGRQADATVIVNMEDTVVLSAVTANKSPNLNVDFLPLTVEYQEKSYAAGKFPGGFFKREGRPSEKETLTARLIDRSIRPLFPKFFYHEVNVLCNVLSFNPEIDPDIPAMLGTTAALTLSGLPCNGPIAATRIGFINESFIPNPTISQTKESKLNLVVAGSAMGVLMVESEATILPENTMLEAILSGHQTIQSALEAIEHLAESIERPKWDWKSPSLGEEEKEQIKKASTVAFQEAYKIQEKQERNTTLQKIREDVVQNIVVSEDSSPQISNLIKTEIKAVEAAQVRNRILSGEARIDGRNTRTVRPIHIRTGVLPRVHGSSLFTRGETQALVSCTLGTGRDEQKIDALGGEYFDRFLFHYNMPPFATGETGRVGTPKRREIGHGRLAKRGLLPVLPDPEAFGYSLRIVSEITESNGSSSMASVCGASLAMMDAGVPLSDPVAGIAMGLIQDQDRFAVLSDILGDEDHLGDMDFKVAGTKDGITALQMDIKIDGISKEVLSTALEQAKTGRLHILEEMSKALETPREQVSSYAPRVIKISISADKIRDVIGKGGAVIRNITEATSAIIDIEDDGTIHISGANQAVCDHAKKMIEEITYELEVGKIYDGRITKILDFGAIVSILPNSDGLLHISQISENRVEKVSDYLEENQAVRVKVIKTDEKGRVRLSMKNLNDNDNQEVIST